MNPLISAPDDLRTVAVRLVVAALVGLAVGIERQWSGHASGPNARFAGMRTFMILGIAGGTAGLLAAVGQVAIGTTLVAAAAALTIAAFVVTMLRPHVEPDGTTEAAAIAVLGLATLAGVGMLRVAAGAGAVIVFALSQKDYLHALVTRVDARELQAAARFAVMALVVLPLLPAAPIPWLGDLSPRLLWTLVLVFSGVNFIGYLAQKAVGPDRGYGIAGLVGGLVSSTAVALQFSKRSRDEPGHAVALARGTVAASTVVPIRLLVIAAAVTPEVAREAVPYLVPPAIVGIGILLAGLLRPGEGREAAGEAETRSPLNVMSSMRMAAFLTVALLVVEWVGTHSSPEGILASAAALGLTDTDALTLSMARFGAEGSVALAAKAIAVGFAANSVFKIGVSLAFGGPAFRFYAAAGLALMAVVTGVGWMV
jgi:uncharacterized membrane protein (DUF4010 family)